jgi:ankyrin repeat protein
VRKFFKTAKSNLLLSVKIQGRRLRQIRNDCPSLRKHRIQCHRCCTPDRPRRRFEKIEPNRGDHSPLDLAAHHAKDTKILELLLTKVEIDQCDSNGITALYSAAMASNAVSARYLIETGADINHRDMGGRLPVHVAAALAKTVDFFNIFLRNEKVDLGSCDERKLIVLTYAMSNQLGLAEAIFCRIEEKNNDLPFVPDANLENQQKKQRVVRRGSQRVNCMCVTESE